MWTSVSPCLAATTSSPLGKLGDRAIVVRPAAAAAAACTVTGVRDSTASEAVAVAVTPRDGKASPL